MKSPSIEEFQSAILEPWSLGDAVIAASLARARKSQTILAIQSQYVDIISQLLSNFENIKIVGINVNYTSRGRGKFFIQDIQTQKPLFKNIKLTFSIRGDFRDYLLAKKLFPASSIVMSGWTGFFARRIKLVDSLIDALSCPVQNRYESWRKILDIPAQDLPMLYAPRPPSQKSSRRVMIHIGAQWRSRAYPGAIELARLLLQRKYDVRIAYGPGDPIPDWEGEKILCTSENIIDELGNSGLVVVNDSAPMHLAAFIGRPTLVIASIGNVREWIPPNVDAVCAADMPTTYRPKLNYMSDSNQAIWPEPHVVLCKIEEILGSQLSALN